MILYLVLLMLLAVLLAAGVFCWSLCAAAGDADRRAAAMEEREP